jgi:hypothetical protein
MLDEAREFLSHVPLHDYKVVIVPPQQILHQLHGLQNEMMGLSGMETVSVTVPQFILANFRQIGQLEKRMTERIRLICLSLPSIHIRLHAYDHFAQHSIFIHAQAEPPLKDFVSRLRQEAAKLFKAGKEQPHFMSEPHITLVRKMSHEQFDKAWKVFSHRSFTARFTAHQAFLLRRTAADPHFKVIAQFQFENLPIAVEQGTLF